MNRVEVAENVLRWALKRSQKTEDDLKIPHFRDWLSGEVRPTVAQLTEFARKTYTPLGYLFLRQPPKEEAQITYFRTTGDATQRTPSPHLRDTVHTMQSRQHWMADYRREIGCDPLSFVGSQSIATDPVAVAAAIRVYLGLDSHWASAYRTWQEAVKGLSNTIEAAGVLVFSNGIVDNNSRRPLDVNEFRGFALVDEYAPLIFINARDAKSAQMFTLAHELAHVFFGASGACDLPGMLPTPHDSEQACDRAAADFLVPESDFRERWPSASSAPHPFPAIARYFKVSPLVAARRALDLHLIGKRQFSRYYQEQVAETDRKRKDSKGGDFYNAQDARLSREFVGAINRQAKSGRLSFTQAYRLTGMYGDVFETYVQKKLESSES